MDFLIQRLEVHTCELQVRSLHINNIRRQCTYEQAKSKGPNVCGTLVSGQGTLTLI